MPFIMQSTLAACLTLLSLRSSARASVSQPFMPYEEPPPADPESLKQAFERQAGNRFKAMIQSHIGG
jgi:hypothetical protein